MKTLFPILAVVCLIASLLHAEDSSVALTPEGRLRLGQNLRLEWRHNPAWRGILFKDGPEPVRAGNRATLSGECVFPEGRGAKAVYVLTGNGADNWNYSAELHGVGETKHISAEIKIPADRPADLEIGGELYRLSGKKERHDILKWSPVKKDNSFRISSGNETYTLSGDFSVSISDLRFSTREDFYCIHLHVPESSGKSRFDMNVAIRRESPDMRTLSLAAAANMGFADPVADDGKGGWSDQGPENDLGCMTEYGTRDFAGIPFEIIDPAKNGGKSAVVVSGIRRNPPHGRIGFPQPVSARYLYLLHAAAWVPATGEAVGSLELTFADGEKTIVPVVAGTDCGNWWNPVFPFENGQIGWTGENASSRVGLFVSAFRIPEKPLAGISFLPGKSVWMIAGASLGNLRPQQNAENRLTVTAGDEWRPIPVPTRIRKDSALDFSQRNGFSPEKDGALQIDGQGHFVPEKEPSRRLRFYATNLGQDMTVPSHEAADFLAERLAMEGFNSVRLHQFENRIYDWTKPSTLDFQPEKLDRFHYLWAKLRERGMYLTTDLHSTRIVRPGDNIEECRTSNDESIRKTLTMFSDSALRNWKEYARKILLMKNPYTGLSMAEDPALFALNLDNEAPLYHTWRHPELQALVEQSYADYLKKKNLYTPEAAKQRGPEFYRFLKERQFLIQREQFRFLKEELGVKAHLTNLNNDARLNLQPFRAELDLVDGHIYHDHPSYPLKNWNVPISNTQRSAIADGNGSMLANMMIRIPGKPMIVTELQFCYPNRFRSEIAILAGAFAALQGWDGLYRFAAGHSDKWISAPGIAGSFDHYHEPLGILTGRIMYFLFVRGDVAEAPGPVVACGWNDPEYGDRFDEEFRDLGLFTRIGSAPASAAIGNTLILPGENWKSALPEALKPVLERWKNEGRITSSTGEITLDRNKLAATVVTPGSEVFTFPGGDIAGNFLSVGNSFGFATISAHSLDGKALAESRDILLFHLTDAINDGTVFQNGEARLMLDKGRLPILARRGRADLALSVGQQTGDWLVEALALDGSVLHTVPAENRDGKLRFRADVFTPAGPVMVYRVRPR